MTPLSRFHATQRARKEKCPAWREKSTETREFLPGVTNLFELHERTAASGRGSVSLLAAHGHLSRASLLSSRAVPSSSFSRLNRRKP